MVEWSMGHDLWPIWPQPIPEWLFPSQVPGVFNLNLLAMGEPSLEILEVVGEQIRRWRSS